MPFSYLGGRGLIRFVCWLVFNFHIHNTRNVLNLTGRCSPEGHLSVSAVCVYIYTQSIYLWEYNVQSMGTSLCLPVTAVESSVLVCTFPLQKG